MFQALIVEDEQLMRDYLKEHLTNIHDKWRAAACAHNGLEAADLLARQAFDLVITDIHMPGMDGLAFARHIDEKYPGMPVILLTGYDEFAYAKQALSAHVCDYLLKPLDEKEMHAALERVAERALKRRDAEKWLSETFTQSSYLTKEDVARLYEQANTLSDHNIKDADRPQTIVLKAQEYLKEHFKESIGLEQVAEQLDISPAYLSTLFHKETGEPFSRCLSRMRLEDAALQLRSEQTRSLEDIARQVGMLSAKHFIKVFKAHFCVTPGEYRKRYIHLKEKRE